MLNYLNEKIYIQVFLEKMRDQYLEYIEQLKDKKYEEIVRRGIELERERKKSLSMQADQLEQQVYLSSIEFNRFMTNCADVFVK